MIAKPSSGNSNAIEKPRLQNKKRLKIANPLAMSEMKSLLPKKNKMSEMKSHAVFG